MTDLKFKGTRTETIENFLKYHLSRPNYLNNVNDLISVYQFAAFFETVAKYGPTPSEVFYWVADYGNTTYDELTKNPTEDGYVVMKNILNIFAHKNYHKKIVIDLYRKVMFDSELIDIVLKACEYNPRLDVAVRIVDDLNKLVESEYAAHFSNDIITRIKLLVDLVMRYKYPELIEYHIPYDKVKQDILNGATDDNGNAYAQLTKVYNDYVGVYNYRTINRVVRDILDELADKKEYDLYRKIVAYTLDDEIVIPVSVVDIPDVMYGLINAIPNDQCSDFILTMLSLMSTFSRTIAMNYDDTDYEDVITEDDITRINRWVTMIRDTTFNDTARRLGNNVVMNRIVSTLDNITNTMTLCDMDDDM